jgi:hypothetical protein
VVLYDRFRLYFYTAVIPNFHTFVVELTCIEQTNEC